MSLSEKKCEPCSGDMPGLSAKEIHKYLDELDGWDLKDDTIEKIYPFSSYLDGLEFVYRVGKRAELEGHHPTILFEYKQVVITLKTHAINALSKNDFILAAKVDEIANTMK